MIGSILPKFVAIALTMIIASNGFAQHKGGAGARPAPGRPGGPTPIRPGHPHPVLPGPGGLNNNRPIGPSVTPRPIIVTPSGTLSQTPTNRPWRPSTPGATIVVRPIVGITLGRTINGLGGAGTITELPVENDSVVSRGQVDASVGVQTTSRRSAVADEEAANYGLKIVEVYKDGGAAKGMLMPNDIIFEVGEVRMQSIEQLQAALKGVSGVVRVVFLNSENGKMEATDVVIRDGIMGASLVEVEVK